MAGDFAVGEVVGVVVDEVYLADGFERRSELVIGGDTGVLKLAQVVIGDEMEVAIRDDLFQSTTPVVGFGVLGVREPTEEVLRTIVERFFDQVMTLAIVGLAFAVGENLSFTVEDLAHEDMAAFAANLSDNRRNIPSSLLFSAVKGAIRVR